jgi:hypothetical protein
MIRCRGQAWTEFVFPLNLKKEVTVPVINDSVERVHEAQLIEATSLIQVILVINSPFTHVWSHVALTDR